MLRRSAHNSTPRKRYTVDAFEGIAELRQDASETVDNRQESAGESQPEDDNGDEASDGDLNEFGSDGAGHVDLNSLDGDDEHTPSPRRRRNGSSAPNHSASKPSRRQVWCGPSPADYEPLEKAVHKWSYPSPLPRREVDSSGCGGFALSFYDRGYAQVNDGKLDLLNEAQPTVSLLNPDEYRAYTEHRAFRGARFLLGPRRAPHLFHAGPGEATPLLKENPGFILNVGTGIQCLEWLPEQNSTDQYLAVSLAPQRGCAFQSQPQYRSTIQIWHFRATEDGQVAIHQNPRAQTILCSDWGDVVSMKWSPFGAGGEALGLLGSVWTDGLLRVLMIPRPNDGGVQSHLRLSGAVVAEYRCPATVFTCMTWLNQHQIAAGCANGFIAVFNLDRSRTTRPAVYRPLADGYIINISSCAPSRPHLIIVITPAGRVTISDLSYPQVSGQTAFSQRVRTGASQFIWSDHSQSAVTTDDVRGMHALPLRKLSYMKGIGTNKAVTTAIAGSPCHPHVLVGGVAGEVTCLNPLQKLLHGRGAIHQQKWFVYEWRRAKEQETEPMSRFTEGYKAEEVRFGPDENRFGRLDGEIGEAAVYEAETAISALSWNPNLHVAGWAAAALGDGLIRVEDIAV